MTAADTLHSRDLALRLAEAEATIAALLSGQIDAVIDQATQTPLLVSRAQEALRLSEERYRSIVETTNDGIGTIDTDGRVTFVNRRFADMLGYTPEEMVGMPVSCLLSDAPEDRAAHRQRIEGSRQGLSSEAEVELVRKDGTKLWGLVRATPIRDAGGSYAGTLALVTDRTLSRRAEQALRESEARFGKLAESGVIGIVTSNVEGVVLDANDAWLKMLSSSPSVCARAMRAASNASSRPARVG